MARALKLLTAAGVVAFMVVGPVGADDNGNPQACGDSGTQVRLDGPSSLWPPNHKPTDYDVVYENDGDPGTMGSTMQGDTLATEGTHDEVGLNGAGKPNNTDIDPAMDSDSVDANGGSATTEHALLAERSGRGDGREYTITYEVVRMNMQLCMGHFHVTVPHDKGKHNGQS